MGKVINHHEIVFPILLKEVSCYSLPRVLWERGWQQWLFGLLCVLSTLATALNIVFHLVRDSQPPYGCVDSKTAFLNTLVTMVDLGQSILLKSFRYHNACSVKKQAITVCELSTYLPIRTKITFSCFTVWPFGLAETYHT